MKTQNALLRWIETGDAPAGAVSFSRLKQHPARHDDAAIGGAKIFQRTVLHRSHGFLQ